MNDVDVFSCNIDILECNVTNGGCDMTHGICTELTPGYSCSCEPGYDLYTSNGTNGYYIDSAETGLMAGDDLYINHTCVRKSTFVV